MGSYLSTPILDKHTEVGCDLSDTTTPIRWAVVDMQGWRKTMEDAHVARTDVMLPGSRVDYDGGGGGGGRGSQVSNGGHAASASSSQHQHAKVFAVFDGHGGAEVARFCSIYLVPMLISRSHWRGATTEGRGGNNNSTMNGHGHNNSSMAACVAQALIDTFHELDRLIDDPNWRSEIEKWREERPPPYVPGSSGGGDIILQSPARSEKNVTVEKIDVDNDDDDDDSEVVDIEMEQQQCRQTIMDDSDFSTEDDEEDDDDEENDGDAADFMDHERGNGRHTISEGLDEEDIGEAMDAENGNNKNNIAFQGSKVTTAANSFSLNSMIDDESDDDELFEDSLCCEERKDGATGGLENEQSDGIVRDDEIDDGKSGNNNNDRGQFEGTVSTVVAAAASALTGKKTERSSTSGMMHLRNDTLALFQKFLRMSGTDDENNPDKNDTEKKDDEGEDSADAVSETEPMNMNGSGNNSSSSSSSATEAYNNHGRSDNDIVIPTKSQLLNPPTGIVPVSASVPTRIQNGRKICNLPDHPVHAGCTSVVSVIVGRTLVVANAGDSRAVICRAGGVAEPLSFDHKPFQNREMDRITNAGGFVNQFGRVNGNLNLSRSIGDLKYKQVPGIPPAEQMITAEPDILSTTLWPGDEFIILGCDGIWDCLSNEECVKYVRDRIDSKVPHEIGREMLDEIVSADPRASQGIGGDNMTIIIVDLLPHTRSYSKGNNC